MFASFSNLIRSCLGAREGVAATEFALIAPVLTFLLIGIFDYGMFINTQMRLENTARSAAEYVLQGGDIDDIETDIINESGLDPRARANLVPTSEFVCSCADGDVVDCDTGNCPAGDYVRRFIEVTLLTEYETLFPYPGLPDSMNITGFVRIQAQSGL